jgi:hypothetical protein
VNKGRPEDEGDTRGPSSRRDEDRPVPHDGDDVARDVAEGRPDATDDDQGCEV